MASEKRGPMVKSRVQHAIRSVHRCFFRRSLPEKLGLYLHSTAGHQRQLGELLGFLREQGYVFSGPGEFLRASGKVAFLSFDDNYRSWMQSLPVLDRHRARATFYVNSWPFRDRIGTAEMHAYLNRIRAADEDHAQHRRTRGDRRRRPCDRRSYAHPSDPVGAAHGGRHGERSA